MKILIVEDEPIVAMMLHRILQPIAREITIADTLEKAKSELCKTPPFDLVTLDLALPDSSIANTVKEIATIKAENPNSAVVIISGYNAGANHGADGFIRKPDQLNEAEMLSAIRNAFIGKAGYEEKVCLLENLTQSIAKDKTGGTP